MGPKVEYRYEISRGGVFLGVLSPVSSPFSLDETIATAGAELVITVGQNVDIAPLAPDPILDETGAAILDETGAIITAERQSDLVGNNDPRILIANDNDIVVYEISSYHPNGKVVYSGYISKWRAVFGGSGDITITCLNQSQDLNNYLIPGSNANVLDQQQASQDDVGGLTNDGVNYDEFGQTFTTGISVTNIAAIRLKLRLIGATPQIFTLKMFSSVAAAVTGAAPLFSTSMLISNTGALADTDIYPATPVPVSANTQYFLTYGATGNEALTEGVEVGVYNTGSSYIHGGLYVRTDFGNWDHFGELPDLQSYFKTYTSLLTTLYPFTAADPSTMLTTIMAAYKLYGGLVSTETYNPTGVITNYTFKLNTIIEGIKKVAELSPSNWYWFVDAATNTLHYKPANTSADHILIKGRHINEVEIEATEEGIANLVYFSGGDDGSSLGTTVFVRKIDSTSLVNSRIGLARIADNRVSGVDGASIGQLLAQNYIDQHKNETYITQIKIPATVYDISLFEIGQMVGLSGFGTLPDALLLQIVAKKRTADMAILTVGSPSIRAAQAVADVQRRLSDLQTIDNPNSPS